MKKSITWTMGRRWLDASPRERAEVDISMRGTYMEAAIAYLQHEVERLRLELARAGQSVDDIDQPSDPSPPAARVREDDVLTAVARRFRLARAELMSASRKRLVTRARHVAMWLLYRCCEMTTQEAAVVLGRRDHATAINAIRRVEADAELLEIATGLAEACGWRIREADHAHQ